MRCCLGVDVAPWCSVGDNTPFSGDTETETQHHQHQRDGGVEIGNVVYWRCGDDDVTEMVVMSVAVVSLRLCSGVVASRWGVGAGGEAWQWLRDAHGR